MYVNAPCSVAPHACTLERSNPAWSGDPSLLACSAHMCLLPPQRNVLCIYMPSQN